MTYKEPLSQHSIAIAISESPDMAALGLAPEHLQDAMTEISRHLLAMGARLVYGGDLRPGGFTDLLFELVSRHRRDSDLDDMRPAVTSVLAWPIVAGREPDELRSLADGLRGLAEVRFLDRSGADIPHDALVAMDARHLGEDDWAVALTAMRQVLTTASDARVVLGGRTEGFKGRMPGIAEEALTAFQARQPLYLLGGFGGCARDIAAVLDPNRDGVAVKPQWPHAADFRRFGMPDLRNGLTLDENRKLVWTVHVDEAVALILRGLLRLANLSGRA